MTHEVPVPMKYVAYCDVLGFSTAVLNDFDGAVAVYQNFRKYVRQWPFPSPARVSVYSDSILVVAEELPAVLHTVGGLHWAALLNDWLIRGGIGYGRHWEESEDGNLFVVSDALVRAVAIEKSVKIPAVVVSQEIPLGIEAWVPRFEHGIFKAPLLYYEGRSLVNPFNSYWFASAAIRAERLRALHPTHKDKYEWFLSLAAAVQRDDILVPEDALARMLEMGILQDRVAIQANSPPNSSV
jgi:hypothetical protein